MSGYYFSFEVKIIIFHTIAANLFWTAENSLHLIKVTEAIKLLHSATIWQKFKKRQRESLEDTCKFQQIRTQCIQSLGKDKEQCHLSNKTTIFRCQHLSVNSSPTLKFLHAEPEQQLKDVVNQIPWLFLCQELWNAAIMSSNQHCLALRNIMTWGWPQILT